MTPEFTFVLGVIVGAAFGVGTTLALYWLADRATADLFPKD